MLTAQPKLKSPYPYFGGKSRVAELIWKRFGNVANYVEPFFGSGAVLLGRPHPPKTETVNDLNAFICNFWRAVKHDPAAVAEHCSFPVNENHLHSVHQWLVFKVTDSGLKAKLDADPDYFDAQVAGRWVWGACSWIGSGWCSASSVGNLKQQRPHVGNAGQGINRQLPHVGNAGRGESLASYIEALSARLDRVRVCCGDWSRVLGPSVTTKHGTTAIFLDPPYAKEAERDERLYANEDLAVSHAVREWAIANGDNQDMRICLAGYEGEHILPETWECVEWKTKGGYGSQRQDGVNENPAKERLWFSPHCLKIAATKTFNFDLFDLDTEN